MNCIKVRNKAEFYWFFLLSLLWVFSASCANDIHVLTEGVADDGSPLVPNTELSAGLDEDLDSEAYSESLKIEQVSSNSSELLNYRVKAYLLNVRKGPGNTYPVLRVLHKNEAVRGRPLESGWVKMQDEGYVSSKYLSSE